MISVANNKRSNIVPYLTHVQQKHLMGTGTIKLSEKQIQNGSLLEVLEASLGIQLMTSLERVYRSTGKRRIPRVKN